MRLRGFNVWRVLTLVGLICFVQMGPALVGIVLVLVFWRDPVREEVT